MITRKKFLDRYKKVSSVCHDIVHENIIFPTAVFLFVILAVVIVGAETYPSIAQKYSFLVLNYLVSVAFCAEIIIKIIAEGETPLRFFTCDDWKWNIFDVFVIIASFPTWSLLISNRKYFLLRIFRLARLGKLIKQLPELQTLINGLMKGISSVYYILMLLLLVIYIFGIVAYYLFHDNDPFHFGSLTLSMLTLIRVATYDNEGDIIYLNMYGCTRYPDVYNTNTNTNTNSSTNSNTINSLFSCNHAKNQYAISTIFFVIFIFTAGFVVLSLFIGSISLAMTSSLEEVQLRNEEKQRKLIFNKNKRKLLYMDDNIYDSNHSNNSNNSNEDDYHHHSSSLKDRFIKNTSIFKFFINFYNILQTDPEFEDEVQKETLGAALRVAMGWNVDEDHHHNSNCNTNTNTNNKYNGKQNNNILHREEVTAGSKENKIINKNINNNSNVNNNNSNNNSGTFVDKNDNDTQHEVKIDIHKPGIGRVSAQASFSHNNNNDSKANTNRSNISFLSNRSISKSNLSIGLSNNLNSLKISSIQKLKSSQRISSAIIHSIGQSFVMNKRTLTKYEKMKKYLMVTSYSIINNINFQRLTVFTIFIACGTVGMETNKDVQKNTTLFLFVQIIEWFVTLFFTFEIILRFLSLGFKPWQFFRKFMNNIDFIIVVTSFFLKLIGDNISVVRIARMIRLVKFISFFPHLSVIINALFHSLTSSGYIGLVLFLFCYAYAIIGMILFSTNDPWHFGQLHLAIISLFRAVTLDNTANLMYINMYGCKNYPDVYSIYPELCTKSNDNFAAAAIYILLFILFGVEVLLTLFIGVLSSCLEDANYTRGKEKKLLIKLSKRARKLCLSQERVEAFRRVFRLLDLDEGGLIEEDELKIGLRAINIYIDHRKMTEYLNIVDPLREGVDLIGFIDFMSLLPSYKRSLQQYVSVWKPKPSSLYYLLLLRIYDFIMGNNKSFNKYRPAIEVHAALLIQETWYNYKSRMKVKNDLIEKRRQEQRVDSIKGKISSSIDKSQST